MLAHLKMQKKHNKVPIKVQGALKVFIVISKVNKNTKKCPKTFHRKKALQSSNKSSRYFKSVKEIVMITCSKKSPERVQAAAEYSPIISKHLTQINLSSPKKAEIRNG